MAKKKEIVLVTGGGGFIGSHIVDRLCGDGYGVAVVDTEPKFGNRNVFYFFVDITLKEKLAKVFDFWRPNFVIHCAALTRVPLSFEIPEKFMDVNSEGTANILELSEKFGVKRVVYSSSSSVYGLQEKMPLKEDGELNPISPYAESKLAGERWMKIYSEMDTELSVCSLRYFNVYGPREPSEGEYALVIGKFKRQFKNGQSFTIYDDGHQRRAFVHVSDVVRANILAMTAAPRLVNGQVFNIAARKNHSVNEVADMIGGKDWPRKFFPPRQGDPRETLADISKAEHLLNWRPEKSLPEEINNY